MRGRNGVVELLHGEWSNGKILQVNRKLISPRFLGQTERIKIDALRARFATQSNYIRFARSTLRSLRSELENPISDEGAFWIAISEAYFDYEVSRDFGRAKFQLIEAIRLSDSCTDDPDVQIMAATARWRLSAIERVRGDSYVADRHLDAALSLARDQGSSHVVGIVLLARGYALLASGFKVRARDSFLEGLFCVGYNSKVAPHYLHAELILGYTLSQTGDPAYSAIDAYSAFQRIGSVLDQGRGVFVTPYPGFRQVNPRRLSENMLVRNERLLSHRTSAVKRVFTAAADQGSALCEFCGGRSNLTVDHIIPRFWGGTDWEGNLRILCRQCNSRRQRFFTLVDRGAYDMLVLQRGRLSTLGASAESMFEETRTPRRTEF